MKKGMASPNGLRPFAEVLLLLLLVDGLLLMLVLVRTGPVSEDVLTLPACTLTTQWGNPAMRLMTLLGVEARQTWTTLAGEQK